MFPAHSDVFFTNRHVSGFTQNTIQQATWLSMVMHINENTDPNKTQKEIKNFLPYCHKYPTHTYTHKASIIYCFYTAKIISHLWVTLKENYS